MFNQWDICDNICLLFTFIFFIFYVCIFFFNQSHGDKYLEIKVIVMSCIFGPILLFYILKSIYILIKNYKKKNSESEINVSEFNILN